jgi:rhamnogalacturonyl hydrolase YesR
MIRKQPAQDFRRWGLETVDQIRREFAFPTSAGRQLGESFEVGSRPKAVAFNWSTGVMLSALVAADRVDNSYRSSLDSYVLTSEGYWNASPPVAGYDVLPHAKNVDRYYDDNEWMVMGLVDAYTQTQQASTLERARAAYRFVLSGEDDRLGGGVYWRESDRASKNTCSNAPAVCDALALYKVDKNPATLATAKRLYAWTKSHLRDPADGLYWDNVGLDGKIGKAKWAYNSGLMLRGAAELYAFTGNSEYASDARELQSASLAHWVQPESGAFKEVGKFMHLLTENWLFAYRLVPGIADPRETLRRGLVWLHSHGRDVDGHYSERWDMSGPVRVVNLIDQASAARAFLMAAQAGL